MLNRSSIFKDCQAQIEHPIPPLGVEEASIKAVCPTAVRTISLCPQYFGDLTFGIAVGKRLISQELTERILVLTKHTRIAHNIQRITYLETLGMAFYAMTLF